MIRYLLLLLLFLPACSAIKDGFTLKKKENLDEFLVEKKNPLIMPPDFNKLPEPTSKKDDQNSQEIEDSNDINELFPDNSKDIVKSEEKNISLPEIAILEEIKK